LNQICVVTSSAGAYYALVSRLRKAELPFSTAISKSKMGDCDLVLTTLDEAREFGDRALALENLDENPGVFKGQVVSRLDGGTEAVLVGIDPGKRTGLAVFYGHTSLTFGTFDSGAAVCSTIKAFADRVSSKQMTVRVGNGNEPMASKLVKELLRAVPAVILEIVDESGTSGSSKMRGMQRDQASAAKIAFRKGEVINHVRTRTRD
jgi:hypothetical protein